MPTLATFIKQPGETQDYDIDFTEYLTSVSDTALSHIVTAENGITVGASTLTAGVIKVWLSGGTDGERYKVTATVTTTGGRVKEADITIKVREA